MINKDTKLFISIASNPGNIGAKFYNKRFRKDNLNAIYIPIKPNDHIKYLKNSLKIMNIQGCSVSMPFKDKVITILDKVEKVAKNLNSVNTIVQRKGIFYGFNTDAYSIYTTLKKHLKGNKKILIVGNGAMSRVFFYFLSKIATIDQIYISSRSIKKNKILFHKNLKINYVNWSKTKNIEFDFLINATPLGMVNYPLFPINKFNFKYCQKIIDAVAIPKITNLNKFAKSKNLKYVGGNVLAKLQAEKQYEIYTSFSKLT